MNDVLHDQLSGLADGPVPTLAPASQVRRRGEDRRRRQRALTGTAALLLLAGITGGALALDRGNSNTLVPAAPTSPTAGPTSGPTEPAITHPEGVRFDGLGPVRVGMTVPEAAEAAGKPLVQVGDVMGECFYVGTSRSEQNLTYMVLDGIVSRIDVRDSGTLTTDTGLGIGATEQQVLEVYGSRVTTTPHPYLMDQGHYLQVTSLDGRYAFIFETDTKRVTEFRSGFATPVGFIEGCA